MYSDAPSEIQKRSFTAILRELSYDSVRRVVRHVFNERVVRTEHTPRHAQQVRHELAEQAAERARVASYHPWDEAFEVVVWTAGLHENTRQT